MNLPDLKVYLPDIVGAGYKAFWKARQQYRYIALKGGRGSKKSCTAALRWIYLMMYYYEEHKVKPNLLVVRRYFNTHRDSTRAQLIWAIRRLGVEQFWTIPKGEHTLTYKPSGQQILFRGMDDPMSITSITVAEGVLCWAWWEEAYQIMNEADFNKVDASLRGEVPAPLFKQHVLTFNPWNKKHWLKRRFWDLLNEKGEPIDGSDVLALTTTYKCNEWLDDADLKLYQNMSPARYLVEGEGEWGISEGAIYKEFIENERDFYAVKHLPKSGLFTINNRQYRLEYINIGVDWGGSKSGHAYCATGITKDFQYVIVLASEWHNAQGTTPEDAYQWLEAFIRRIQNKYGQVDDVYADSEAQMMLNMLKARLDIGARNSLKRPIIDRIDFTTELMAQRRLFLIPDDCTNTAEFFRAAIYDPKVVSKKRLDDGSYDVDSGDAFEYSVERFMNYVISDSK